MTRPRKDNQLRGHLPMKFGYAKSHGEAVVNTHWVAWLLESSRDDVSTAIMHPWTGLKYSFDKRSFQQLCTSVRPPGSKVVMLSHSLQCYYVAAMKADSNNPVVKSVQQTYMRSSGRSKVLSCTRSCILWEQIIAGIRNPRLDYL